MSHNPHVLLVHGAWVGGWEFAPVVPSLQALGWTVETLELPSTGSTGSLAADAAALATASITPRRPSCWSATRTAASR